ncbi:class I SAM-dependent methyltransferase [bacterium SCSIO 12643]|nr:class I SAM-dependent methyltransferase [bacterium SCSIO 12643]
MRKASKALVVGGGADNTVLELLNQNKVDTVTHVDISKVLSEKSQARIKNIDGSDQVTFLVRSYLEYNSKSKYDAILFPYYLDLFDVGDLKDQIKHTATLLKSNSCVYVIDFSSSQNQSIWMKLKVRILYLFFYPVIRNRNYKIPDFDTSFKEIGFKKEFEECFYGGFYSLKVFTK